MSQRREYEDYIVASSVVDELLPTSRMVLAGEVHTAEAQVADFAARDLESLSGTELYDWHMATLCVRAGTKAAHIGYAQVPYVAIDDLPEAIYLNEVYDNFLEWQRTEQGTGFFAGFRGGKMYRQAGMPLSKMRGLCQIKSMGDPSGMYALQATEELDRDWQHFGGPGFEVRTFVQSWLGFLRETFDLPQN